MKTMGIIVEKARQFRFRAAQEERTRADVVERLVNVLLFFRDQALREVAP